VHILGAAGGAFWLILFLILFAGLCTLIYDLVWQTDLKTCLNDQSNCRFLLTKTAALTAVLGALVALPFTIYRLKLTTEQNRHNEDVLFNEKLHQANNDLHAMRQVTKEGETHWEDDIIRRNGAIDRLEALAIERPATAPRIARILCVYLKEMTKEYQAEKSPDGSYDHGYLLSTNFHELARSDMENAAQVLGRLHANTKLSPKLLSIDLSNVNLQAMDLSGLNFDGAILKAANLEETDLQLTTLKAARLERAKLNGSNMSAADLRRAKLHSAKLNSVDLSAANLSDAQLDRAEFKGSDLSYAILHNTSLDSAKFNYVTDLTGIEASGVLLISADLSDTHGIGDLLEASLGDANTLLPKNSTRPDHWPAGIIDIRERWAKWELFKQNPDAYVPPQLRKE